MQKIRIAYAHEQDPHDITLQQRFAVVFPGMVSIREVPGGDLRIHEALRHTSAAILIWFEHGQDQLKFEAFEEHVLVKLTLWRAG